MKRYADRNRKEVVRYKVGDKCYSARMWTDFRVRVSGLE